MKCNVGDISEMPFWKKPAGISVSFFLCAEEENGQSANRMSCVSLTRRLSRVFVLEENEVSGECDASPSGMGKRVSANRRESLVM